jgi:RNA 3'-phosphate cyclase
MIEIDGSHGEGGGQILRTSLSLSAVTEQPVRIFNIRAGRQNPGLSPQHVTSIESVVELADAEVDGLHQGSKEITFRPKQLVGGTFEFDVGTAGSISLVIQSCILPAAMSRGQVTMSVRGGTDVRWSPPIDYLSLVHLPMLRLFEISCEMDLISRGFYPEGGGEVRVEIAPSGKPKGAELTNQGKILGIEGVTFSQNLPDHVATRIKHAAVKTLVDFRDVKIGSDMRRGHSTGAGIVLAARTENTILGESALGEKGIRSEVLGENCAQDLKETIRSGATVDQHMVDQILPCMALAEGPSAILAEEITGHAETNMWVIEEFLGKKFTMRRSNGLTEIRTI